MKGAINIDLTGIILKGRYCIVEQVGRGGEGSMYLARDLELGIFRAVNNNKLYSHASCDSTQQIYMIQTWPEILKRQFKISNGIRQFISRSCSGVYPIQPGNLIEKISKHQIGEIS